MTKIQEYRKAAGLTQAELAKQADVSIKNIQRYELIGINGCSVEKAVRIADALGCSVKDMVEVMQPKMQPNTEKSL